MDVAAIRRIVEHQCPGRRLTTVIPLSDAGQHNRLYLADGNLVLRFPRAVLGLETLGRVRRILQRLHGAMPVPTPHLRCSSPEQAPLGQAFLAYDYLRGLPLSAQALDAIADQPVRRALACQLGGFLAALHASACWDEARDGPSLDGVDEWLGLYTEIQARLFAVIRPAARKAIVSHFERYLGDPGLRAFAPRLRHGDFGTENVLYDPARQVISGVIDFDGAGFGDPAVDLAAASCWGDAFFNDICAVYPDVERHLARAAFYRGTFALQEALYGLRVGDREAYESGLESFR